VAVDHPVGINVRIEFFWNNSTWSDATSDVRYAVVQSPQRGRLSNTFDPGRLVVQVDNSDRKYDPLNAAGSLFGDLKPGRLARVFLDSTSAASTQIWRGMVDRIQIDYDKSNKDSVATITCVDALALAASAVVPAGVTPGITDGEDILDRSIQIAAAAGNYTPSTERGITTLTADEQFIAACSGQTDWDASRDHNYLDEIRKVADLEQGPAISSSSNHAILLYPRHWFKQRTDSSVSQVTIGEGGLPFHDLQVLFDADEIITAVAMTSSAGDAVVAIDTAGEAEYGTRYPSVTYSDIPAQNDEQLEGAANTVIKLRSTEEFRIDSLTIKPGRDAGWQEYAVGLGLLDRVTVAYTPTFTGSQISADYFIDGWTHTISPGDWTTVYSLMPANRFDEALPGDLFIVGSSLVGGTDLVGF
jgi:hypothetical protein